MMKYNDELNGDDDDEGSDGEMDETESGPHWMMWAAGEAQLAAALLLTHLLI